MKGYPYVPWYHGDFLRSTPGWTLLERAVYWMLLCAQWETGQLPNDLARLASIAGIDMDAMSAVWPLVSKKFKATASGLVNKRMQEHKTNCIQYRTKLSEGGKKGMKTRWGKRDGKVIDLHPRSTARE